jgi:UDP-glucose 4-epimerase
VYVGDVVAANLRALDLAENGPFNIGTGIESDVNRIFGLLNLQTGGKAKEVHGPAKPGEQRRSVIRFEKARERMGWEPKVGLDEGLKRTVEFFRSRR